MLIIGTSPPTDMTAVQDGVTSVLVSWTPSSDATGYMIYYISSGEGSSDSETVTGGDANSYTLSDLINGENYTISIVAMSNIPSSETVTLDMAVGLGKSSIL